MSLAYLIAISIALMIATWFKVGFSLMTFTVVITTAMFAGRLFGYYCKLSTIVGIEGLSMFLTYTLKLILKSFTWKGFLFVFVFRLIFILIVNYDNSEFVYISEEKRRED